MTPRRLALLLAVGAVIYVVAVAHRTQRHPAVAAVPSIVALPATVATTTTTTSTAPTVPAMTTTTQTPLTPAQVASAVSRFYLSSTPDSRAVACAKGTGATRYVTADLCRQWEAPTWAGAGGTVAPDPAPKLSAPVLADDAVTARGYELHAGSTAIQVRVVQGGDGLWRASELSVT